MACWWDFIIVGVHKSRIAPLTLDQWFSSLLWIKASANVPIVPDTDQTPDLETPGAQMSVSVCVVLGLQELLERNRNQSTKTHRHLLEAHRKMCQKSSGQF